MDSTAPSQPPPQGEEKTGDESGQGTQQPPPNLPLKGEEEKPSSYGGEGLGERLLDESKCNCCICR